MFDIDRIRIDPVLGELFAKGQVPYDTTLRAELQKLGRMEAEQNEFLFQLVEILLELTNIRNITIDIDGTGTAVEG